MGGIGINKSLESGHELLQRDTVVLSIVVELERSLPVKVAVGNDIALNRFSFVSAVQLVLACKIPGDRHGLHQVHTVNLEQRQLQKR